MLLTIAGNMLVSIVLQLSGPSKEGCLDRVVIHSKTRSVRPNDEFTTAEDLITVCLRKAA